MSVDKHRLDQYLSRLERALGQISVGDRSEIILEIKSHVLESQEKHPEESLNKILAGLGEPETVANKYLLDRGLKPGKSPRSPMIKWLTIGFLTTFAITALSTLVLIWKFTPLISVNGDEGSVKILGGLISISDHSGFSWTFDDDEDDSKEPTSKTTGKIELGPMHKSLRIVLNNARAHFVWNDQNLVEWNCKTHGPKSEALAKTDGEQILLTLMQASKCEIVLPKALSLFVSANNGKLHLNNPLNDYDVEMNNGLVSITPDPNTSYRYTLKVTNGNIADFQDGPDMSHAKTAKVSVNNGTILHQH